VAGASASSTFLVEAQSHELCADASQSQEFWHLWDRYAALFGTTAAGRAGSRLVYLTKTGKHIAVTQAGSAFSRGPVSA
jgi:hypothetical protein